MASPNARRIVAEEARTVAIEWLADKGIFTVRLLYGKTFVTPVLKMETYAWNKLMHEEPVRLFEAADHTKQWLVLHPRYPDINIEQCEKHFKGDPRSEPSSFGKLWRAVDFQTLYLAAQEARDATPEEPVIRAEHQAGVQSWLDTKRKTRA